MLVYSSVIKMLCDVCYMYYVKIKSFESRASEQNRSRSIWQVEQPIFTRNKNGAGAQKLIVLHCFDFQCKIGKIK